MKSTWDALNDIVAGLEAQQKAEAKAKARAEAEAARRAPRVIARYLTVGQAHVTVTETGPRDDDGWPATTVSACGACPDSRTEDWRTETYDYAERLVRHTVTEAAQAAEVRARAWAQGHAEVCRALPND